MTEKLKHSLYWISLPIDLFFFFKILLPQIYWSQKSFIFISSFIWPKFNKPSKKIDLSLSKQVWHIYALNRVLSKAQLKIKSKADCKTSTNPSSQFLKINVQTKVNICDLVFTHHFQRLASLCLKSIDCSSSESIINAFF